MKRMYFNLLSILFLLVGTARYSHAQYFISGPIPMCDTSYFTTNISGIGILEPPNVGWGYTLYSVCIDITTNHPQTLVVSLTSPGGTTLLLSAYNGAGGSNYTSCCFDYGFSSSITSASAPFTGTWTAQGGSFSAFDWQSGDGTWTITVVDTACSGGSGPGGSWTNGFFNGGPAGGGMTFYLNSPPPPLCNGWINSASNNICAGENVDILGYYMSMNPNYSYTVYQGVNLVPNPTAVYTAGVYNINAFESWSGCTYTATYALNIYPQAALGPDRIIDTCLSGLLNLNSLFSITGFNTAWTLNGSPITTAQASATNTSGLYELIATNIAGCNDTVLINLNYTSNASIGLDQSHSICSNELLNLTTLFNTAGLIENWSLNSVPVVNPSAINIPGTYILIASSTGGCADTAQVIVSNLSTPTLGADQNISVCTGNPVDLNSFFSTSGFSTSWTLSGSPVANPASVNTPGAYTLIANSANSCTDTADLILNVLPSALLGSNQLQNICGNTSIDLTTLYNTTGFTASWTNNSLPVTNPSAVNLGGTYTLIATAANSCPDTAEVIVTVMPTPVLGSDQVQSICNNTTIDLTTLYNTAGYTANWSFNSLPVATPASVNTAGTYTLIATAFSGCADTAEFDLYISPSPVLGVNQSYNICGNTELDLTSLYNTTGYSVSWTLNGSPVAAPASINVSGTYVLIASATGGCADTASVNISSMPAPSLGADQSVSVCSGSNVDLTGFFMIAGLTSVWTESGNVVADPSNINATGNYQLIATNTQGCNDTAMVNVIINALPVLGAGQSISICEGNTVDLSSLYNTSGFNVTYSFNNNPITGFTAVSDSGIYIIRITDANGCTNEAIVVLSVVQCLCPVDFTYVGRCIQDPVTFNVITDSTIINARWIFSNSSIPDQYGVNPSVNFPDENEVLVRLEAKLNCGNVVVEKYVSVDDCSEECNFYLPIAFTPNNDGLNDQLMVLGNCEPEDFELNVHNRFGQLIYHSNNPHDSWDGKFEDSFLPADVYVLHIEYKLPYQNKQERISTITIIR